MIVSPLISLPTTAPPLNPARLVAGDPTKPGLCTTKVKLLSEVKLMGHWHPEDRRFTVTSGLFYLGLGKAFGSDKLQSQSPVSFMVPTWRNTYVHWARSGKYVTQISALGPLGLEGGDAMQRPGKLRRHQ